MAVLYFVTSERRKYTIKFMGAWGGCRTLFLRAVALAITGARARAPFQRTTMCCLSRPTGSMMYDGAIYVDRVHELKTRQSLLFRVESSRDDCSTLAQSQESFMAGGIPSVDSKFHKVCHMLLSEYIGTQELECDCSRACKHFFSTPRRNQDKVTRGRQLLTRVCYPCRR